MRKQKFKKGDRVKVLVGHAVWTNDNGKVTVFDVAPMLKEDIATVIGSHRDIYGRDVQDGWVDYTLRFDKYGQIAWFHEKNIVLVEKKKTIWSITKGLINKLFGK